MFAFAETVLSGQAVQMHNPQIAQLHTLCMLICKRLAVAQVLRVKIQKLAQFGRKNSTSMLAMLAAFSISAVAPGAPRLPAGGPCQPTGLLFWRPNEKN